MHDLPAASADARLRDLLAQRIAILDGAYGSLMQGLGLTESDYRGALLADHDHPLMGNHDVLSITQPTVVAQVHEQYLSAGADIIKTNSFTATAVAQADYGLQHLAPDINRAAAQVARAAADRYSTPEWPRFVAGVLGPTNKTASLSPDVNVSTASGPIPQATPTRNAAPRR